MVVRKHGLNIHLHMRQVFGRPSKMLLCPADEATSR